LGVGFGAGSASDILARLIGEWLSERLGQQFIVENRLGAGSNIATEAVVKAPPDGHMIPPRLRIPWMEGPWDGPLDETAPLH